MYRGLRPSSLALATGVLFAAGSMMATTITTTSYNNWKATLTGAPTDLNFSTVTYASYNTPSGITLSATGNPSIGFVFTGPDGSGWWLEGTAFTGHLGLGGSTDSGAGINVATPGGGENAILLSVASTSGSPLTLTLSDGESFSIGTGLFGLTLSHPITSALLTTSAGSQAIIDDFVFGTSSLTQDGSGNGNPPAVSEGATFILVAAGSLILIGARRRFASAGDQPA
jgi:hypothetical protein